MSKSQAPKKHHFVPQVYLKNFCLNGRVFVLDVNKVKQGYQMAPSQKTPGQICYIDDYYKIEKNLANPQFALDKYDPLHIETQVFKRLENRYPHILKRLFANKSLAFQDAVDLTDFILQIKLRNPYWFDNTLNKKKQEMIDAAIDSLIAEVRDGSDSFSQIPMELKVSLANRFRIENKADPHLSKQWQLSSLIDRDLDTGNRNERFRIALMDHLWVVYKAPKKGPYFITSDNPGYSLRGNDGLIYNTNFTAPFTFFFPISPTECLVVSSLKTDPSYSLKSSIKNFSSVDISGDLVILINNNSLQCISHRLIAIDDWYLSQIAHRNNPTLSGKIR